MRVVVISTLVAGSVFAQSPNGGVWTGYVGGWKSNEPAAGFATRFDPYGARRQRSAPRVVVVPYAVPVAVAQPQPSQTEQLEAERRAWDAEQARLASQAQLETERRLAAEREVALLQNLEAERRLAAEREALAAEKLKLEQEERARLQALAAAPPPTPPEPVKQQVPQTPGNDIYRWTDASGVTHYSTNVPPGAKAIATKVGAR